MKTILVALLLLLCSNSFSQADCATPFQYRAVIVSKHVNIDKIGLPTSNFIDGLNSLDDKYAFEFVEFKDSVIQVKFITHISGDFCGMKDIINEFFLKKKEYPIQVLLRKETNNKISSLIVNIPIEFIKFTTELINYSGHDIKTTIIDLGRIEI